MKYVLVCSLFFLLGMGVDYCRPKPTTLTLDVQNAPVRMTMGEKKPTAKTGHVIEAGERVMFHMTKDMYYVHVFAPEGGTLITIQRGEEK